MNSVHADRLARARRRRPPVDPGDLERLLTSAADRDDDAWASLVRRFEPSLRRLARSQGLGAPDAEDVVQSTWLELFLYIRRVREPAKVGAWLHTTARRESIRTSVAARRERPLVDGLAEPSVPPEAQDRLEAAERRAALTDAVQTLPEQQRRLMQMLLTDPAPSYEEISAALDIPIGSIGPTRGRSFERLRRDQEFLSVVGADGD